MVELINAQLDMEMYKRLKALKGKHTLGSGNSKHNKKGGHKVRKGYLLIKDFIEMANLQDLGFRGPDFMLHRGDLYERLDRAISNDTWLKNVPYSFVTHLLRIKLYHRPLLLSLKLDVNLPKGRPFRFLAVG
ncbi:hypothetical protein Gorai_007954 [Gossypium raimondii]|uniref:Uncharacterized protein n=1 Tax=Gossypium raimondii TaxID=29730 RepID=A0A7J8Q9Q3_GOSRA|nr:hypothetical protein [Gossypium raimondii]